MKLRHLLWIPAAGIVSGSTSFVFGDLLPMPVDLYYLIYFVVVLGFFAVYVRTTRLDLAGWMRRRIAWALPLGILGGVALTFGVLARPATPHLSGAELAWAIAYRGVLYGSVDGVLLFAFPWIVVWRALEAEHGPLGVRLKATGLALVAVLFMTTAYHLGYSDFRSSKLVMPNVGSLICGIPTLASANPVASVISHAVMHVSSVVHSPGSELYLPPHRE